MSIDPKTKEKDRLHHRNRNREPYDLEALKKAEPQLLQYIKLNKYGAESVDFANPKAVKFLNKALLNHYYGVENWDFPDENLCPPIPGRADYLHYISDLLSQSNFGKVPRGNAVSGLDVGVGANCIYPIIGVTEYDWYFRGTDVEPKSIESAKKILDANPKLASKIELILKENTKTIFKGIIQTEDILDFTMCNPPFHSSAEEAMKGTKRKVGNLSGKKTDKPDLNFAGVSNELIYEGGEIAFIERMIKESKKFSKNCYWYTTLVSKESNLKKIYKLLDDMEVVQSKTIPMGTGNKSTRIVAWSYLTKPEQLKWKNDRWKVVNP